MTSIPSHHIYHYLSNKLRKVQKRVTKSSRTQNSIKVRQSSSTEFSIKPPIEPLDGAGGLISSNIYT